MHELSDYLSYELGNLRGSIPEHVEAKAVSWAQSIEAQLAACQRERERLREKYQEAEWLYVQVQEKQREVETDKEHEYWQGKKDGMRMTLLMLAPDEESRKNWHTLQSTAKASRYLDDELAALEAEEGQDDG